MKRAGRLSGAAPAAPACSREWFDDDARAPATVTARDDVALVEFVVVTEVVAAPSKS